MRTLPLAPLLTAALLVLLAWPTHARAQEAGRYDLDWATDGGAMLMAGGFFGFSQLIAGTGELSLQAPKDTDKLLAIDRWLAERDEPVWEYAAPVSDVTMGVLGAFSLGNTLWLGGDERWEEAFLLVEASTINMALGNLAKIAIRRPRPLLYRDVRLTGELGEKTDDSMSFYSLHTGSLACWTGALTYMSFQRDPNGWEGWTTLGVGGALTFGIGALRIMAQKHFPTDVIAGGLIGAGVGILVPHLHRRSGGGSQGIAPASDMKGLTFQGTF